MKNQNVHPSLFAERTSKNIELYNLDKNHPFIKAKKIIRPSNTNIKTFERSKSYNVPSSTRIKNNLFEPSNDYKPVTRNNYHGRVVAKRDISQEYKENNNRSINTNNNKNYLNSK